jgi:uncharacterized protein (TIGR02996 family)
MTEDDAWIEGLRKAPADERLRLVYADWLEERGHLGAAFLRTEVALTRATGAEARSHRRRLLEVIPRLPPPWRNRFEQPDLLLAPPVPFAAGWYSANAHTPQPYRSLPNLDANMLPPDLPWLSGDGVEERVDQAAHEREELKALAEVQRRAARSNLILPPGFESFARDFPRRNAVSVANTYFQVCLHDAVLSDFPDFPQVAEVADGFLISFFADMNYGNPHQRVWSLYLVPGIAWHCVVAFELPDEDPERPPDDSDQLLYCAPSFQAFLYRWWLGH